MSKKIDKSIIGNTGACIREQCIMAYMYFPGMAYEEASQFYDSMLIPMDDADRELFRVLKLISLKHKEYMSKK